MSKGKSDEITVTVKHIPRSLWKRIRKTAIEQGRTVAEVVTEALGRYADKVDDGNDGR